MERVNATSGSCAVQGCDLHWSLAGNGPPVVLIQGVGVAGSGWLPQVDALSQQYRCLWFDNRGMGRSQPVGAAITVERMAQDTLALMDAQGWGSAHLVGHSLGGLTALYMAHAAPERVRSLSLLCTFATGAIPTRMEPNVLWIGMRSRLGTRSMRRNAFLELVMPKDSLASADRAALASRLGELFGHDPGDQPPVAMKQFAAMRRASARPYLASITAPTLVVSAEHDIIAPPYAGQELAQQIPGARFVQIADAAHGVTIQDAARVNALLLEHLAGAEGRAERQRADHHPILRERPTGA